MRTLRIGLSVLLAFAVLAFGSDPTWAQLTLAAGVAALLIDWGWDAIRRQELEFRCPRVLIPVAFLLGLGIVQSLSGLSAYRYATNLELARDFTCLLLAFLWAQAFRQPDERKAFVWFALVLAFSVSVFAIAQHFTWNGKIYWLVSPPPGGSPFGPYVNSDHFAGFVELTAPLGMALLFIGRVPRDRLLLLTVLTIVPIGALVLTESRAGITGLLFEILFLLLLGLRTPADENRRAIWRRILAFGAIAALLVVWLGAGPLLQRLGASTLGEISHERRIAIYRDSRRIFLSRPFVGTGLGTFRAVYPQQESYWDGRVVVHAHSDYLELLAEAGVAGGLCGAAFVFLLLRDGWRLMRFGGASERALRAGALAACSGLLIHDLVDFNLHVPANALLFLVLAVMATVPQDLRSGPFYRLEARGREKVRQAGTGGEKRKEG